MTVAASKDSSTFAAVPDDKGLTCQTTYNATVAEKAHLNERSKSSNSTEDFRVDVTDVTNPSMDGPSGVVDSDATEYSSSFGDTASRSENTSGTSDAEVESEFWGENAMASMYNTYDSVLPTRRKKVSSHWRNFIRPLMWRCKWTELRIKELDAQAKKYSRELEEIEQTKLLESDQYASEFCSKSSPFVGHCLKRKSMKRRKRKQVEKMDDLTSLTSHHRLFSYIENKKSDLDSTSTVDDIAVMDPISKHDEFALPDEWFSVDETFLEQIFSKIETVHSRVYKLRNNLDSVMLKNGMKFSSSENLSLISPFDAQTSSAYSPPISAGNDDITSAGAMYTPQQLSDFEIGDLALPEVISSCAIVPEIPDIIESTIGLLSAADVTIHRAHLESAEKILDDALLLHHDDDVDDDGLAFDGILDESFEMELQLDTDEHNSSFLPLEQLIPEPIGETILAADLPKTKRKRGERKAGSCGWNL
ncbi:hypothetical protein V2J09_006307 [Rumex salicifolius]